MKVKSALVTGGSGFIGKHLIAELIKRGYKAYSMDRRQTVLPKGAISLKGDITRRSDLALAMAGRDIVFHLGGVLGTSELQKGSSYAVKVNIIGTLNVFDEAIKNPGQRVVLISKPNPWLNTYSITKDAQEKFCLMYQRDFGLTATIVKWFSVYGPGQRYDHVQKAVPTFIINALRNKPLPVFDSGRQTADFIFVEDVVKATVDVAENSSSYGKIVEIGTGKGVSVLNLAKTIIKLTKSRSKIDFLPMRMGEPKNSKIYAHLRELKGLTKFKPNTSLTDGLVSTIDYYKDKINA